MQNWFLMGSIKMKCSKANKCKNYSQDAYICNYSQDYGDRCYKYKETQKGGAFFRGYLFGAIFCFLLCLIVYFLFLRQSAPITESEEDAAKPTDKSIIIELSGRFLELHPYNESVGYECLQIAKDFKGAVSEFGYQPKIEIGCTNESKERCHAWIDYDGIEIYGRRDNYPIKLAEDTERYFLTEG